MNLKQKINQTSWYRQGGGINMLYCSVPYRSGADTFDCQIFFKGHNNYGYFNKDNERRLIDGFINKHLEDKNYLANRIDKWEALVKRQRRFLDKLDKDFLSSLSDKDFFKVYRKFCLLQLAYWHPTLMIEYSDPWSDKLIDEHLKKQGLKISPRDLSILTSPNNPTFIQREELDLLLLAKDYLAHKDISRQLANHAEKYYWQGITWLKVRLLTERYFLKRIKESAKSSSRQIKQRIGELTGYPFRIIKSKLRVIRKHQLKGNSKAFFDFFARLSDWREERKKYGMINNHLTELFAAELSKRSKVDKKLLYFLDGFEITDLARIVKMTAELKKRQQAIFYNYTPKGIWRLVGKSAEKMNKLFEDRVNLESGKLKGFVACPGRAVGVVKVIMTPAEFKKFKPKDILVTQMTRPEFIPLMKMAAAVITDEGGITSHAAVISREYNKPCIIGTQVATSFLKDGDMVEVDADKGIVRKL